LDRCLGNAAADRLLRYDDQDAAGALLDRQPVRRQDLVQNAPRLAGGGLGSDLHLRPHELAGEDDGQSLALQGKESFAERAALVIGGHGGSSERQCKEDLPTAEASRHRVILTPMPALSMVPDVVRAGGAPSPPRPSSPTSRPPTRGEEGDYKRRDFLCFFQPPLSRWVGVRWERGGRGSEGPALIRFPLP